MNIELRQSNEDDIEFLKKMLYQAVYWNDKKDNPSFDQAFEDVNIKKCFDNWGSQKGDVAVIATVDSIPVGAAWMRHWSESNTTRGYINEQIPVLAIGISKAFRHQGIGSKLMSWMRKYASAHNVPQISLCVSKENYALKLYQQQGYEVFSDIGQSYIMINNE